MLQCNYNNRNEYSFKDLKKRMKREDLQKLRKELSFEERKEAVNLLIAKSPLMSDLLINRALENRPNRANIIVEKILKRFGFVNYHIKSVKTQVRKHHLSAHDTISDIEIVFSDDDFKKNLSEKQKKKLSEEEIEKLSERILTLEIQLGSKSKMSKQRIRYTMSSVDVDWLASGMDYKKLPNHILAVLSKEDILGNGRAFTTVSFFEEETGRPYDNGQKIVFLNGAVKDDEENPDIVELMHDLLEQDPNKIHDPRIKEILLDLKENEEERMQLNADAQKIIDDLRANEDRYIKILEEDNATLEADKASLEIDKATLEADKATLQEDNLAKDEIIKTQDDQLKMKDDEIEELKKKLAESQAVPAV